MTSDRHYHVFDHHPDDTARREAVALDAASVDDAIREVTDGDPDTGYTVAPCADAACVAALAADEATPPTCDLCGEPIHRGEASHDDGHETVHRHCVSAWQRSNFGRETLR